MHHGHKDLVPHQPVQLQSSSRMLHLLAINLIICSGPLPPLTGCMNANRTAESTDLDLIGAHPRQKQPLERPQPQINLPVNKRSNGLSLPQVD